MEVKKVIKDRYDVAGPKLCDTLTKKGYEAYYVGTAAEAKELALKLIPEGASISWGGSATIADIGLQQELRAGGYKIIDRDTGATPAEKDEIMRQSLLADVFLMSTNAITKDGEMINVDGRGNRVAALCFGPKEVIVIFGMNKVVGDLNAAYDRVRNVVAPINTQRLGVDTPCKVTGYCGNCYGPKCICSQVVVTRQCKPAGRIKAIVVGEDLGF